MSCTFNSVSPLPYVCKLGPFVNKWMMFDQTEALQVWDVAAMIMQVTSCDNPGVALANYQRVRSFLDTYVIFSME